MMKDSVTLAGSPRRWTINGVAALSKSVNILCFMKTEEDQGAQDEEGDRLFQIPFDSSEGLDHDIGKLRDPQRGDLQDEIRILTRDDSGSKIPHT